MKNLCLLAYLCAFFLFACGVDGPHAKVPCPEEQGSMAIELFDFNTPDSRLVVAGEGWTFSHYRLVNSTDRDQVVTSAIVAPLGDDVCEEVTLAMAKIPRLRGIEVDGAGHYLLDETFDEAFVIPAHASKIVEVQCRLAPLSSDAPKSGDALGLRLLSVEVEDDAGCPGYAEDTSELPPSMIIRKSVPRISRVALASNVLVEGRVQDLIVIRVDALGLVALKHFGFLLQMSEGLALSDLRLRRDGDEVPTSEATLKGAFTAPDGFIFVDFVGEDLIDEVGAEYALSARVAGVGPGAEITTHLPPSASPDPMYDGVSLTGGITTLLGGFALATIEDGEIVKHPTSFLWSDLSFGASHSAALVQNGGSHDWINDPFVSGIGISETLSSP